MKRILVSLAVLANLASLDTQAQPKQWSLRDCCDYAVTHNISIKQKENSYRQQEIRLNTAKNSRLPDVSGSVGQNFSFGRGLTADNTYSVRVCPSSPVSRFRIR